MTDSSRAEEGQGVTPEASRNLGRDSDLWRIIDAHHEVSRSRDGYAGFAVDIREVAYQAIAARDERDTAQRELAATREALRDLLDALRQADHWALFHGVDGWKADVAKDTEQSTISQGTDAERLYDALLAAAARVGEGTQ